MGAVLSLDEPAILRTVALDGGMDEVTTAILRADLGARATRALG